MRGVIILLILIFLSQKAVSSITPAIHVPSDFNKNRFVNYNNAISNGSGNNTCDKVAFKNYYPSEYTSLKIKNPPFSTWFCWFSVDVIHDGYGPNRLLPEKVYFDEKTGIWKKKKYTLSKESIQRSKDVYGIVNLSELQPVHLYNIQTINAHGYAVIDNNVSLQEQKKGVKKKLSFCLIRDEAAFCGSGSMINLIDGKEVDFTPYMLISLETVELGVAEHSQK